MRCFAWRCSLDFPLFTCRLALFGLSLVLIGPFRGYCQAIDELWNNTGKGDWFTAGNWIGTDDQAGVVPTITTGLLVNNGGTPQIGANNAVAGSLSIGAVVPNFAPPVAGSTVEILNGGNLQIGTSQAGGPLTIGPRGNLIVDEGGGFLSYGPIENDGNITLNRGTFFGTFNGGGTITKLGSGTVTFQAVLSNLANVLVDDGIFIDSSTSIGTAVVNGPKSVLRVNSGITLVTVPTVNNGGTVDNFGNITAGVISNIGPGNIINETGGKISSPTGNAIVFNGGGTVTNNAGGVISGTGGSAVAMAGGPGTLINSGVINGTVTLGNSANTAQLFSGSTINGDLNLGTNPGSILILDGPGVQTVSQAVTGTITNAGSLTKQGSGTWIIDKGLVLSNLANVLVDDGIFIDSSTSIGTAVVTGPKSVLRVNSGITLVTVPTVNNGGTVDNFGNITAGVISNIGPGNIINETGGQISSPTGNAIVFNGGGTVTNNAGGAISGTGGSAVAMAGGLGTLINSGVINGTVTLGNSANTAQLFSGSTINGDLNLGTNPGTILILGGAGVQTVTQAVTGTITNAGSLTKQGSGTWIIDKVLNAPVATNVMAGVLNVDGQLNSPVVNVQAGGTLKGTGLIGPVGGTVTNAGNLSPGNSPGTLTISGNYTQTSTGTYNVSIVSASDYTRLIVGGHAALDGTLKLTLASGFVPSAGNQFSVLTATGGVSGTFRTVVGPNGQVFRVTYSNGVVNVTSAVQTKIEPAQFHLSDGTPTSTTALMANSTFYDFGSLSNEMAQSGDKKSSIGVAFDAGEFTFEGHHGEEYGFPITGQFKFNDRIMLQYQVPLQYVEISNIGLFQSGLTLELPTRVIVPLPDQPWSWDVTPAAAFAASGSREIIGAGALTNSLAYRWPWLTLTYGNYISFLKGHTLTTDDAQFPTGVDQQIMKNGLKVAVPFGNGWVIECYCIYTQFFQSAPVSSYVTAGAEIGHHFTWNVEGRQLDLGYLSFGLYTEEGNHYSSGHFRVGSAWKF